MSNSGAKVRQNGLERPTVANTVPTTDEMDHTTPEERRKLMGFCEHCEEWWKFEGDASKTACPKCGGKHSNQIGFQIMSQRTFDPVLHGKKKFKKAGTKRLR